MKPRLILAAVFLCCTALGIPAQTPLQRSIAITIDDLPVISTRKDLKTRQEITHKLLQHISKAKIPVIGFVNENKLYTDGNRDDAQVDLLRDWVGAGLGLGNHTYLAKTLPQTGRNTYGK